MGSLLTSRMQLGMRGEKAAFVLYGESYHNFRQIYTERLIKRFIIGITRRRIGAQRPIMISGISCKCAHVPTFAHDTLIARWTRMNIPWMYTRCKFRLSPQKPHVIVSLFAKTVFLALTHFLASPYSFCPMHNQPWIYFLFHQVLMHVSPVFTQNNYLINKIVQFLLFEIKWEITFQFCSTIAFACWNVFSSLTNSSLKSVTTQ